MDAYLKVVLDISKEFQTFLLTKIPREENSPADALAALASTSDPTQRRIIPVESIDTPSIKLPKGQCMLIDLEETEETAPISENDWREEIKNYLAEGKLPEDRWAARRLKIKSAHYTLLDGKLLRISATGSLLTCLNGHEAEVVIKEIHEGAGGNHSGGRSLTLKIRRLGYFWPTMVSDCEKFATKCEKCQRHAPLIHAPTEFLKTGVAPYPFMRWAMDIVGPLQPSRQKKFMLIMTDYFTKWVEAESYSKIQDSDVQKFVWKNIICRHGLPYEIVTDNGTQFTSSRFEEFCARWNIRLSKSTPRNPQGNGQAEATNKRILDGLKKRLAEKKGLWADELDGVLWSHRTTPRSSTGKSPFSLAHGVEALAPAEANIPSLRRTMLTQNPELNDEMMKDYIDDLEENREQTLLRLQNYQQKAAKYYNKKVKGRNFTEGDLVLRKVFENTAEVNAGKLGANWEGPYLISKIVKPGVYELVTLDGQMIPRSWNSINLKRFY